MSEDDHGEGVGAIDSLKREIRSPRFPNHGAAFTSTVPLPMFCTHSNVEKKMYRPKKSLYYYLDFTSNSNDHGVPRGIIILEVVHEEDKMMNHTTADDREDQTSHRITVTTSITPDCRNKIEAALYKYTRDMQDYQVVDVPKTAISTLPPYQRARGKRIVVVTSASSSEAAVSHIRAELESAKRKRLQHGSTDGKDRALTSVQFVGFDTETRPKYHKGGDSHPPALIQIATFTTAYLFRLQHDGMNHHDSPMTKSLQKLLSDRSILKVGAGIRMDARELNRVYGANCCGNGESYLDLIPLAKERWPEIKRCGLRNLTATVLHCSLSKAQQMKNWEIRTLTPAMIEYAAADAFVALDLLSMILLHFDGYSMTIQTKEMEAAYDDFNETILDGSLFVAPPKKRDCTNMSNKPLFAGMDWEPGVNPDSLWVKVRKEKSLKEEYLKKISLSEAQVLEYKAMNIPTTAHAVDSILKNEANAPLTVIAHFKWEVKNWREYRCCCSMDRKEVVKFQQEVSQEYYRMRKIMRRSFI